MPKGMAGNRGGVAVKPKKGRGREATQFKPGNPGKAKGTKNKTSRDLQQQIVNMLPKLDAEVDGHGKRVYPHGYLAWLAAKQPSAFSGILGRVLPKDVSIQADVTVSIDELISRRGQKES